MTFTLKEGTRLYHGTRWACYEGAFTTDEMLPEQSEWNVSWFTQNENIAERFSEPREDAYEKDQTKFVVLGGKITKDLELFSIEEDCFPVETKEYQYDEDGFAIKDETTGEYIFKIVDECLYFKDFMNLKELVDVRDLYTFIRDMDKNYDGSIASGSLSGDYYEDIALFYPSDITTHSAKWYDFEKGEWSLFENIENLIDEFKAFCEKNE
jgi:hypothetical protein